MPLRINRHQHNIKKHKSKWVSATIKTHSSELRDQEEAGLCDKPVSYLQVAPL